MRRPVVLVRLLAPALLVVVLLAPAGAVPADAASPTCPQPPITVEKIQAVVGADAQLRCFGGRLLTFRAYVVDLPHVEGLGGTTATPIEPAWLNGLNGSWVAFGTKPGQLDVVAYVPPALGACPNDATCPFRWYWGRWATVSAHFDGPVARTCRYASQPPGERLRTADAIAECRKELIILGVGPIAPPATAAALASPADPARSIVPLALGGLAFGVLLASGRRRPRRR